MTEQIESAIDHYRDVCVQMGQYPESDTYRYAELAIRSLQAWEEVLQELDKERGYLGNTLYQRKAYEKSIDIINQHLSEIEEVR